MQRLQNDIYALHMDDIRNLTMVVLITITNNGKNYWYSPIRLQCSSAYVYA
jgi:hypothetical protein